MTILVGSLILAALVIVLPVAIIVWGVYVQYLIEARPRPTSGRPLRVEEPAEEPAPGVVAVEV